MIEPVTYCKFADEKRFQAYDLNKGVPVRNLIYATMLENTKENHQKLQKLADLNKRQGLQIQLRQRNKIIFKTH